MRFLMTFVLHLYLDSECTNVLCGNLQTLTEDKPAAFKNKVELLALLDRYAALELQTALQTNKPQADQDDQTTSQ